MIGSIISHSLLFEAEGLIYSIDMSAPIPDIKIQSYTDDITKINSTSLKSYSNYNLMYILIQNPSYVPIDIAFIISSTLKKNCT